jgi:hypothetical protein
MTLAAAEFQKKFPFKNRAKKAILCVLLPVFLLWFFLEQFYFNIAARALKKEESLRFHKYFFSLRRESSVLIPQVFDDDEFEKLEAKVSKLIFDEGQYRKLEMDGSVRYKFKSTATEQLLQIPTLRDFAAHAKLFTGRKVKITFMLSNTASNENDGQLVFAGHPHIDTYRHQLKVLIPLTDIQKINGPTEVLPGSHKAKIRLMYNYFLTWIFEKKLIVGEKQFLPNSVITEYNKQGDKTLLTMKRKSVALLNTRALHRATNIKSGKRSILWMYLD